MCNYFILSKVQRFYVNVQFEEVFLGEIETLCCTLSRNSCENESRSVSNNVYKGVIHGDEFHSLDMSYSIK